MADLFAANAGLSSRFPHKFAFADYSAPQLAQIARLMIARTGNPNPDPDPDPDPNPNPDPDPDPDPDPNPNPNPGFALSATDADAEQALERLVAPIVLEEPCGNARSVENRVAAAIAAQSTRLRAWGAVADGAHLFELTAEDCAAAAAEARRAAEALWQPSGEASERQGRARG